MPRQPREWLLLNLLEQNWDATNTFGLTPDISFGNWNEAKAQPQVTIPQPDEGPIGGGDTGYDAFDSGGGIPHQTVDGVLDVDVWARDRDLGGASTDAAAKYCSGDKDGSTPGVVAEIQRIVRANADRPTDPVTGNQPVQTIAPGGSRRVPEDDVGSEVVHFVVPVRFLYRE